MSRVSPESAANCWCSKGTPGGNGARCQ
jgi:hypothetical protein